VTYCLQPEDVILLNRYVLVEEEPHTLLRRGQLESALRQPNQTFDNKLLYPALVERAAVLLHGLVNAHAFLQGNKRTAWISTTTYLRMHRFELHQLPVETVVSHVEGIADGLVYREKTIEWLLDNRQAMPRHAG